MDPESSPVEQLSAPADGIAAAPLRQLDSDSLAGYLARCLMADRQFRVGVPDEAAALLDACDTVLSRLDGMTVILACILDRDDPESKPFALNLEELRAIGASCLHYSGTMSGVKLPVVIEVFDVGSSAASADRSKALEPLVSRPGARKVAVRSWVLDGASGQVWSNAALRGLFRGRLYLEKLLRKPRRTQSELRPAKSAVNVVTATPYATVAISAILALLFIAEILFGIGGKVLTPTIKTLVAMGGLSHALAVEDKEYYRVFTAPMLHGSAIHLGLNVVAMVMGGVVLEALLGRAWLCALFVIGALGGAAGSLLSNAHNVVSVGASGAIMGLLGAALVVSFRIPSGQERINIQMGVGRMLIPSLIPLATHRSGGSIDYGAHIGGAIAGALAALAIFSSWHPTQVMPPFRRIALGIALAGALAVTGSFGMIGKNYAQTTDILQGVGLLVPNADLPKDQEQWQAHLDEFEKKYPRDPRVQINLALRHRERNELAGAEAALRKAVAEDKLIKTMFSSNTRIDIIARALLAEILVNDGRRQQALEIAAPVCHRGEAGAVPMEFGTLDLCK